MSYRLTKIKLLFSGYNLFKVAYSSVKKKIIIIVMCYS